MQSRLTLALLSTVGASVILSALTAHAQAPSLADSLSGKILLQVEGKGEAWYVNPLSKKRFLLGRPDDALKVIRQQGTGISDADLQKIPVGLSQTSGGQDTDSDGLADALEDAIGTNAEVADTDGDGYADAQELRAGYSPQGPGRMPSDAKFATAQKGRIFLQVQKRGQAWWVNPADGRRYFLGRPSDALALMRTFALGVTNKDLEKIHSGEPVSTAPATLAPVVVAPSSTGGGIAGPIDDAVVESAIRAAFPVWNASLTTEDRATLVDGYKAQRLMYTRPKPKTSEEYFQYQRCANYIIGTVLAKAGDASLTEIQDKFPPGEPWFNVHYFFGKAISAEVGPLEAMGYDSVLGGGMYDGTEGAADRTSCKTLDVPAKYKPE